MIDKPIASLSLDLDNKWSYMKTHGNPDWKSYPSYLDIVIPRALRFLKERNLKITFFIVGKDASIQENHAVLKKIVDAGHEIGNHSYNHEPWWQMYSEKEIDKELAETEKQIQIATGSKPVGFRAPGYCISEQVLNVLVRRKYQFDCSSFPTFLGPLMRAYYFMTARLTSEEIDQRKELFGTIQDGFRPNKPYFWRIGENNLAEIPVTTMPFLKVPIHFSYILYLANAIPFLSMIYFRFALGLCRVAGVGPSLLLHPLDFISVEDAPELDFFPAMSMPISKKLAALGNAVDLFTGKFKVLAMGEFVQHVQAQTKLSLVSPRFS